MILPPLPPWPQLATPSRQLGVRAFRGLPRAFFNLVFSAYRLSTGQPQVRGRGGFSSAGKSEKSTGLWQRRYFQPRLGYLGSAIYFRPQGGRHKTELSKGTGATLHFLSNDCGAYLGRRFRVCSGRMWKAGRASF